MSMLRKRFWKEARAVRRPEGWAVELDGRPVRTPGGALLAAPTAALGRAIAAEWDAQGEELRPGTMPLTRSANSAIDRVAAHREETARMIAEFGGSDLLCYRAEHPRELVARQAAGWDPLLEWARARYGAPLVLGQGVMHVAQPPASLAALRAAVAALDPFRMVAMHELTTITGSLILALAVLEGRLSADEAWALSRIDEEHQAELWGRDAEAEAAAARRKSDLDAAARLLALMDDTKEEEPQ
ncbi:ATP12 family chaperone protein [Oceanicella actignis]|uniref:Chaperone required for the assembly of the F1-ATPase n=1 Tax=Oceanicella actignis TaxID=1189325 RepID=A0A1M7TL21_9RHOB|nr:ATP12 family protein [Oceanicella actignis]SET69109.1 Chaperone required for the assembly of the F1-ATPase [Oceanicella actignis]SHN71405.1 Chaperone required for the assembly of the F1-ATPase [Oceanicella actignis]